MLTIISIWLGLPFVAIALVWIACFGAMALTIIVQLVRAGWRSLTKKRAVQ